MCAGALLIAFGLAFVYTAGLMLANANGKLREERCYQLAKSFSQVLAGELEKPSVEGGFRKFADRFLDRSEYLTYNPEYPDAAVYHYALRTDPSERYGKIRIRLRKELNDESAEMPGGTEPASHDINYTGRVNEIRDRKFQRYLFIVDTIAEYEGISYCYSAKYYREDRYRVEFAYGDDLIVWKEDSGIAGAGGEWRKDNEAGARVDFGDPAGEIRYSYRTDETPVFTEFVPVHKERE